MKKQEMAPTWTPTLLLPSHRTLPPQVDTTNDSLISVQHTADMVTVMTHFNTMGENLNHQFYTMSENFNQQLSTQYSVIQSLLETIKVYQAQVNTNQAQVTTASQLITNIETQLTSIQNQASTFVANSKIQDLEKEIQNLKLATAPDPQITSLQQDAKDLQLALPTYLPVLNPTISKILPTYLPLRCLPSHN